MAGETDKLKTRLAALNTSLGELESLLEPLLTQSLPETLLNLDPMQQAKFQTVLPYVIYDLVFSEYRLRSIVCVIKSIQYI
jgi:exosome complex protein LRP1